MMAELDDILLERIPERRTNGFRVSRKLLKVKARKLYDEGQSVDTETKALVVSDGWVKKCLNRNELSIR